MIFGIVAAGVGGLLGLLGLSELASYSSLTSAGNPFAGLKGDLGIALLGSGAVGVLAGIALIIVATQFKAAPRAPKQVTEIGAVNGPYVWDGSMWVFPSENSPTVGT